MGERGRINHENAWRSGLVDWSALNGCFGTTKISPMDLDGIVVIPHRIMGIVERRGKFLVLEKKTSAEDHPSLGEVYTFDALKKVGLFSILVFWPSEWTPTGMYWWGTAVQPTNYEGFREIVSAWFQRVNQ